MAIAIDRELRKFEFGKPDGSRSALSADFFK